MSEAPLDRWLSAALFAVGVAAVAAQPYNLGESDESILLYETVRMLRGEVYLRDVFDFIPPGSHAVFAALFSLFGATIATARVGMAVVHGLIVALAYRAARRLEVRPALAAAAALAHLALAQPVWPYASPHWLATLLTTLALVLALGVPGARRAALLGVTAAAATAVNQHKGVLLLACAGALPLAESVIARRSGPGAPRSLGRQLGWLAAGYALVAVPFFGLLAAWAGPAPTWAALVEFPLRQYRGYHRVRWGEATPMTVAFAVYTIRPLLVWLPAALLPAAARAGVLAARGGDPARARRLVALVLVGLTAVGSIAYNPDFIHLAVIAPLLLVALAADVEWALVAARRLLPAGPWARRAAWGGRIAMALVLLWLGAQTAANLARARRAFPTVIDTPFGRVALRGPRHAELVAAVRRLADAAPSRRVFVYPTLPALYLMTGTDNPTPFQILVRGYNPPVAFATAMAAVEQSRTPLIVVLEGLVAADDPFMPYVRANYVRDATALPGVESVGIYRRSE